MREYERMKKALIITTISGFVPQFEMNQVFLLQKLGYEVHYATNFGHPVYDYDRELFRKNGIVTHPLSKLEIVRQLTSQAADKSS